MRCYDVGDRELAKKYGVVDVDEHDRVTGFLEKPEDPPTTLCATATYLYTRDARRGSSRRISMRAIRRTSLGTSSPGCYPREPVYAYRFEGDWYDIGDATQLLEADNRMRRRRGLPERTEYSPD